MLTLNALYIYMNTKSNSLSQYRKDANLPLHDVAYLLNIDKGNLSKIERGQRYAHPRTILLYHILFGAPLVNIFSEQLELLKETLQLRSKKLIKELKIQQPPKSNQRIAYIESFVNSLTDQNNER